MFTSSVWMVRIWQSDCIVNGANTFMVPSASVINADITCDLVPHFQKQKTLAYTGINTQGFCFFFSAVIFILYCTSFKIIMVFTNMEQIQQELEHLTQYASFASSSFPLMGHSVFVRLFLSLMNMNWLCSNILLSFFTFPPKNLKFYFLALTIIHCFVIQCHHKRGSYKDINTAEKMQTSSRFTFFVELF